MTGTQSLTDQGLIFHGSPGTLVLSVMVVLLAAGLGWLAWRRSGYAKSVAGLELLRVAIVALVAVLFNQPEWVEEFRPDQRPSVAVLWDQSPSMLTEDVFGEPGDGPSSAGLMSRAESIAALTEPQTWAPLEDRVDVIVEPFSAGRAASDSSPADRPGATILADRSQTDLSAPLLDVASRMNQLSGIVLISDGDWTTGQPPVDAAAQLRMRDIPIFTVATGSPQRLPDLELASIELPTFATAGKPVRIPFAIDSSLPRDVVTTVTLRASDGETVSKQVRIAAMARTTDAIVWKPAEIGDYTISLEFPTQPGETIADNNQQQAPIAIREEKLRVLVVESYPRWEYRYLRNALSRDPGVEVSCLLFHPTLEKVGGGSTDYLKVFPEAIDELTEFDVVFLGDVGLDDGQLTAEQCNLIKGLVEHQASGLVLMPGWQGRQLSLLGTELAELYPVQLDLSQPGGWGSRTPGRFELTAAGRRSLLTKLVDGQEDNVQVWEDLPGFQWYAPAVRAKLGTEVLAVHGEISNEYGRLPLLVTQAYGAGKVLFMGTDGAWRWRMGVEDKYHYRFWGQVVRWMAYQRNMNEGETMRLYYTPDQPQFGQTMSLHAHVMDRDGEPLERGDVVARIRAPSGQTETVRMRAEGESWGVFRGSYEPAEPGQHELTLACKQTAATLELGFVVQGHQNERPGMPARPEVLQELSLVSRGKSVAPADVAQVIDWLAELPLPAPSIRRSQLWSHPLAAMLLILLLAVFWVWRKAVGLI